MNGFKTIGALAFAFALATPVWAQDMAEEGSEGGENTSEELTLDGQERLRQLEEQVKDLREALGNGGSGQHFSDDNGDPRWGGQRPGWKLNLNNTADRPKAVSAKLGGYFSLAYRGEFGRDRSNTTHFDQHRFVPQLDFQIHDFVTFSSEIEIEGGGSDVDFLGDNEILVEYAELEFKIMDEFRAKAGLILVPFGRYNMVHDDPLHDLFDRPFVARRIVPSAFDQPGIAFAGDIAMEGFSFHYDLAVTQGFDDEFTTNGGSRDSRQSFRGDDNSNKAVWLRASVTPDFAYLMGNEDIAASMGISVNQQTIGHRDFDTTGWGIDGQARWNPQDMLEGRFTLAFEGEWAAIQINRDDTEGVNNLDASYIQLGFQYRPWNDGDWKGWLRDSGYVALTLRYECNDLDDRQVGGSVRDDREAFTFGLAFRPFLKTVIRSEWKAINSSGQPTDEADRFVFSISTYF
ncbi:MAG: hypothetical protein KDB07_11540 [Planctomycetes bacterium]|nr:hypothetical protein [Planctomycetota bacterium]